uniref:Uncharacterized protein n=1 Tax=Oryza brachyantha TaxID=4533 RepID=J3L189_ORYBR
MATHAMPWLVAAALVLLLVLVLGLSMLRWLVAGHAGVGGGVHVAHARRVEAGEEDVAVGEGTEPQEVPRHAVAATAGAGAGASASSSPADVLAAPAVGGGSCQLAHHSGRMEKDSWR